MKDIDQLLTQQIPKPNRPLKNNFAQTVSAEITSRPRPDRFARLAAGLRVRPVNKFGAASFAGLVLAASAILVGGTVLAITILTPPPKPTVTPTITKQLPSGNRIVGVDAQNCRYFLAPDGSAKKPTNDKTYYEIRQDSTLTNQQLVDAIHSVCQTNLTNNAFAAIIKQLPGGFAKGMAQSDAYIIKAITKDSLTAALDVHYPARLRSGPPQLTYTQFASNLIVQDTGNNSLDFGSLQVGDTIEMLAQDTSGKSTASDSGFYNTLEHPEAAIILAILKIPALTSDPTVFYRAVGRDLVRVEPCTTSPTGFCRAYEFIH